MKKLGEIWRGLTSAWYGCPGDGCSGIFRSPERASEHAWVAKTIGSHDVRPQRRFLRERNRTARQLRKRGVSR